jgi:hypothetical protein
MVSRLLYDRSVAAFLSSSVCAKALTIFPTGRATTGSAARRSRSDIYLLSLLSGEAVHRFRSPVRAFFVCTTAERREPRRHQLHAREENCCVLNLNKGRRNVKQLTELTRQWDPRPEHG